MEKLFLKSLKGYIGADIPIWLMRQAGRYLPEYRYLRKSLDGLPISAIRRNTQTEVTLQPLRRYHFDAAILFSDILVVPHALGQSLTFEENKGPILEILILRVSKKIQ